MQMTKMRAAGALLAAAFITQPVMAAEEGYFIGFGAGVSSLQIDDFGNDEFDDQDTAYQLHVGYNFSRNWGVQVAYNRTGDFDDVGVGIEVEGIEINGMYSLNVTQAWSVHARLGVYNYDISAESNGSGGQSLSGSGRETDGIVTLGTELVGDETLRFSLEGKYVVDNDADLFSVLAGLNIGFGGNNAD